MSKEKDLTDWVSPRSNTDKRLKSIDSPDDTLEEVLGFDKGDFEQYDAIRALEEKECVPNLHGAKNQVREEQSNPEIIIDHPPQKNSLEGSGMKAREVGILDVLERIIFNEHELKHLKTEINKFTLGNITSQQLKKTVLTSYIRIFEDIDKFISFLIAQESKKLGSESNFSQNDQEEKDKLLDELAVRINNIYTKLKAFPDTTK